MARDERIRRDAAGVGPDPEFSRRLYPIDELKDYRIASGEPDIRGWEVRTLNGREVGEVEDLLVDPARGEVVMLEVDLDNSGRHVNVPLRAVQLDREHRHVIVDSADLGSDEDVLETRARERMTDEDRRYIEEDIRDSRTRDVRYGFTDRDDRIDRIEEERLDREVREADRARDASTIDKDERIIEEVVVRRRVVDPDAVEKDRLE
ncbi:MAG: hypothetical protein GX539_16890 [Candidatus Cloacimonetes bacterium]|jgi:sporulation protein YlmC with PRC-barrel domain|nr:hypothetical protein [Candidatus Cloacimonadota bacterium]